MQMTTCPICSNTFHKTAISTDGGIEYDCTICGPFSITRSAEAEIRNNADDYRISAWIREHKEEGKKCPKITTYILDDVIKNLPYYKPLEKQLLLIRAIERQTNYLGDKVLMKDTDYPLAHAKNRDEFKFLCRVLEERKLIWLHNDRIEVGLIEAILLADGWEYLDKYTILPAFNDQAFVAMSFSKDSKDMEQAWADGIKPAIVKAGYKASRVDKEPHIDRIDAKIISDIKDSFFMVADVTEQKQGVYFEAGFAIGLNRPVIWCVRKDELEKVHFDTRQYNHIVWETPADLQEQLYNLICAVIGRRHT